MEVASVKANEDDNTMVDVVLTVTAVELAWMARAMYDAGTAHEEVTASLERMTASKFRDGLVEISDDEGGKRWMLRPVKYSIVVGKVE